MVLVELLNIPGLYFLFSNMGIIHVWTTPFPPDEKERWITNLPAIYWVSFMCWILCWAAEAKIKTCSHFLIWQMSLVLPSQEACSLGHVESSVMKKHFMNSKALDQDDLERKGSVKKTREMLYPSNFILGNSQWTLDIKNSDKLYSKEACLIPFNLVCCRL